jgi:hypothetical protein
MLKQGLRLLMSTSCWKGSVPMFSIKYWKQLLANMPQRIVAHALQKKLFKCTDRLGLERFVFHAQTLSITLKQRYLGFALSVNQASEFITQGAYLYYKTPGCIPYIQQLGCLWVLKVFVCEQRRFVVNKMKIEQIH